MRNATEDPVELGIELRAARKAAGLTQPDLAERAGVSERTIRNLEAGRGGLSPGVIGLVLRALNHEPEANPKFPADVELIVNTIGYRLVALPPEARAELGGRLVALMMEDAAVRNQRLHGRSTPVD